jgi:MSHA biogenesis protein MshJ
MKALLKRYAERLDAATLRERVMIFAAGALMLVFLVNAALIDPLRSNRKLLAAENAQRQTEMRVVQAELQRMAQSQDVDPDAEVRQRANALRAELARLNPQIAAEQRRFTTPDRMRDLLDEMLERNKRLRLVELKTLPASSVSEGSKVFRHGVEMTVSGAYLDLYEYLSALERLPTQLYWGRAELSAGEYPETTLKLTVYTVSFDKAWLIV